MLFLYQIYYININDKDNRNAQLIKNKFHQKNKLQNLKHKRCFRIGRNISTLIFPSFIFLGDFYSLYKYNILL